jgi:hypothetical protein
MKRGIAVLAFALLSVLNVVAQNGGVIHGSGDPSTLTPVPNCAASRFYIDDSTQDMYVAAKGSPCVWTSALGPRAICRSTTDLPNTGNTTENIVYFCTIPAGTLGANSSLYAQMYYSDGANSGTCTYRVYWSQSSAALTLNVGQTTAAGASRNVVSTVTVQNRNSTSAQAFGNWYISPTNLASTTANTAAVNTTANTTYLIFTSNNSVAGDACTTSFVQVDFRP